MNKSLPRGPAAVGAGSHSPGLPDASTPAAASQSTLRASANGIDRPAAGRSRRTSLSDFFSDDDESGVEDSSRDSDVDSSLPARRRGSLQDGSAAATEAAARAADRAASFVSAAGHRVTAPAANERGGRLPVRARPPAAQAAERLFALDNRTERAEAEKDDARMFAARTQRDSELAKLTLLEAKMAM